jgi:hypothetical protein
MILQAGGINSWHKEKHKHLEGFVALFNRINFVKRKLHPLSQADAVVANRTYVVID